MIYTSGTTGVPKGVRARQDAICWETCRTAEVLGLDRPTGLGRVGVQFRRSYGLVFPVLAAGGALIVPRREDILYPKRFYQFVVDEEITFTSFSPSYLRLVMRARQSVRLAGSRLRALYPGRQECVAADVRKLWSVLPEVRVFNRYGPTETTVAVTTYEVTPDDVASGHIPIGTPHRGTDFFLVDEDSRLVPGPSAPGELYIGGKQLIRGYWGDEKLSERVLRVDVVPGQTLYKTGDLVYRDPAGRYMYMGRLDDVVKRNGVRISLAEVARAFHDVPGVTAVACALVDLSGAPASPPSWRRRRPRTWPACSHGRGPAAGRHAARRDPHRRVAAHDAPGQGRPPPAAGRQRAHGLGGPVSLKARLRSRSLRLWSATQASWLG